MADEKTPKARIELGSQGAAERGAARDDGTAAPGAAHDDASRDDGSYTVGEAVRDGAGRVSAWVSRAFPGHENAFWGGVVGLLVAVAFFVLGPWRTALIAVLVVVGVAVGQMLDGDPKIINTLRKLFSRNQ